MSEVKGELKQKLEAAFNRNASNLADRIIEQALIENKLQPVRPKVYIAGPMRGIADFNFPAFIRAEADLTARGYDVISPARMDLEVPLDWEKSRIQGIARDLRGVLEADYIALLPGWQLSTGASAEAAVAVWAGKKVLFQSVQAGPEGAGQFVRYLWSEPKDVVLSVPEVL